MPNVVWRRQVIIFSDIQVKATVRRARHFSKVLREKRSDWSRLKKCKKGVFTGGNSSVLWNKISAFIKRRNWRGTTQRSKRHSSDIEEASFCKSKKRSFLKSQTLFSKEAFLSQKPDSFIKSWACSETSSRPLDFKRSIFLDLSSLVTCTVSFAEITGSFVRKRVTGTVHPSTGCRQE